MKSLPTRQLRRQLRAYRRVNAALCLAALDASISSPVARRAARQPTGHLKPQDYFSSSETESISVATKSHGEMHVNRSDGTTMLELLFEAFARADSSVAQTIRPEKDARRPLQADTLLDDRNKSASQSE